MFRAVVISLWLITHPGHVTMTSIDYVQGANARTIDHSSPELIDHERPELIF